MLRTGTSKLASHWGVTKVTGNAKAMTLRERKMRKKAPPCVIYRGEAAMQRMKECSV